MTTINDIYLGLLEQLLEARPRESRGMRHFELQGPTGVTIGEGSGLVTLAERKLAYTFGLIERLSYLSGRGFYPDATVAYAKNYANFIEADGTDRGAYGPRMAPQLRRAYRQLQADPQTRQAVVNVHNHLEDGRGDKANTPCTLALHFIQGHDGALELVAYMRSNDIMWGFPYDVSAFRFLQQVVARWLGWEVGRYTHVATSLHLYERDVDAAKALLAAGDQITTRPGSHPSAWDLDEDETTEAMQQFWAYEGSLRHAGIITPRGQLLHKSACLSQACDVLSRLWLKRWGS